MKRKILFRILVVFGTVIILTGYGVHRFFFCMKYLPEGEFLYESTSPNATYTVKLYEDSPVLSAGCTRGEVINNKTGEKRNIYWEHARNLFDGSSYIYGRPEESILWETDEIVIINGKRLDVNKDTYDFRRE